MTSTRHDLEQAVTLGCDRLVPASVIEAGARARRGRLIGAVLTAPVPLVLALATIIGDQGFVLLLGAVFAILAICWSMVLLAVVSPAGRMPEIVGLATATLIMGAMLAAAGGLSSPLAVLLVALPLEAYWVGRDRKATGLGATAALAAMALHVPFAASGLGAGEGASAWHWLAPIAYAVTVLFRLPPAMAHSGTGDRDGEGFRLEDRLPAVILDLADNGEVVQVSEKAEAILGIPPELLLGQGLFERLRIPDRAAYRCALADVAKGEATVAVELRLRLPRSPGGGITHRLFQVEMFDGGTGRAVAVLRPADELAELRAALAKAEETAGSTEAAKARFLATVSHELRTPLNAIIGFSDMMLHEALSGALEPRQREHVSLIRDAGRHLLSVVNAILDLSKIEAGTYRLHPEAFRFDVSAELCRSMLEPLATEKQLDLSLRIAHDLGEVRCDQRAIQQILINLLSNAIKFTPEGGSVSMEAKLEGDDLVMRVSDTGIGMSQEDLAQIGQPFAQVSNDYTRHYEGTGLGLCLVGGLVELHGGGMTIESAPGLGTTVTVTLPQSDEITPKANGKRNLGSITQDQNESYEEGHERLSKIA